MNSKVYKWCAVPQCKNTSIKTPKKVFVHVPNVKTVRDKWLKLARRDPNDVVTNSPLYFCEDHFDLPNDMENYMQYHVMGSVSQVRMIPGCMPKKFICQPDRKTRTSATRERPFVAKKQKKMILEESLSQKSEEKSIDTKQSSSEEITSSVSIAKQEWKKLRDNHRDALKRAKLGKNKLLPAHITTWKYAKNMQFLEPHMKYRITENIEMDCPSSSNSAVQNDNEVTTPESNQHLVPLDCPKTKRRCVEVPSPPMKQRQEKDALESFFSCILQTTREMPTWMQTQVKKKIFAVIIEAEECLSCKEDPMESDNHEFENSLPLECDIKTEVVNEDSSDANY